MYCMQKAKHILHISFESSKFFDHQIEQIYTKTGAEQQVEIKRFYQHLYNLDELTQKDGWVVYRLRILGRAIASSPQIFIYYQIVCKQISIIRGIAGSENETRDNYFGFGAEESQEVQGQDSKHLGSGGSAWRHWAGWKERAFITTCVR